eukprot:gene32429-40026_t
MLVTLGVDGNQVGVLEKTNKNRVVVGLSGLLQGEDGKALKAEINLKSRNDAIRGNNGPVLGYDSESIAEYKVEFEESSRSPAVENSWKNSLRAIAELLKFCTPSPFGDLIAQETRIDPSVRLAMECPAERMQIKDAQQN